MSQYPTTDGSRFNFYKTRIPVSCASVRTLGGSRVTEADLPDHPVACMVLLETGNQTCAQLGILNSYAGRPHAHVGGMVAHGVGGSDHWMHVSGNRRHNRQVGYMDNN